MWNKNLNNRARHSYLMAPFFVWIGFFPLHGNPLNQNTNSAAGIISSQTNQNPVASPPQQTLSVPLNQLSQATQAIVDQVSFNIHADRVEMTTKESMALTLTLSVSKKLSHVPLPEIGPILNKTGFRITNSSEVKERSIDDKIEKSRVYQLAADIEGSYLIPPIEIGFSPDAQTKPVVKSTSQLFVEVKSFLDGENAPKDIKDIAAIIKKPFPQKTAIIMGLAAAGLVIILIGLTWYYRRRKNRSPIYQIIPLYQRTKELLINMQSRELTSMEEICDYYFSMTELFKSYLEERFRFRATDQTTEELAQDLRKLKTLDSPTMQKCLQFFYASDMVKFARELPSADTIRADWQFMDLMIEQTSPAHEKVASDDDDT